MITHQPSNLLFGAMYRSIDKKELKQVRQRVPEAQVIDKIKVPRTLRFPQERYTVITEENNQKSGVPEPTVTLYEIFQRIYPLFIEKVMETTAKQLDPQDRLSQLILQRMKEEHLNLAGRSFAGLSDSKLLLLYKALKDNPDADYSDLERKFSELLQSTEPSSPDIAK